MSSAPIAKVQSPTGQPRVIQSAPQTIVTRFFDLGRLVLVRWLPWLYHGIRGIGKVA